MYDFNTRVFIVTGAGSGIGRALATQLDAKGAQLALCDIDAQGLEQTASSLKQTPLQYSFDVSKEEQWQQFKDKIIAHFQRLDGIINNAGIAHEAVGAEYLRTEDLKKVMDINFYGVVYGSQTFLPLLKQASTGVICNISSIFGITGIALQSAYCASKFAVRGYTESLRMEALKYYPNLQINVVHPGGIKTPIAENSIRAGSRTDRERQSDNQKFNRALVTSADSAANSILSGIANNKARILIGLDAKMMDMLARITPVNYSKALLKKITSDGLIDNNLKKPLDKR